MTPLRTGVSHRRAHPAWVFLLSLVAGLTAVSHESLWIDEANSALKAMQPSLSAWWNVMATEKGSDLQMPLYMLQLWAWDKLLGHTEFTLRAVNIAWFCIGQLALFHALRREPRLAWIAVILGTLSPLLWFYLNDARPYIMQYAGTCLLGAALVETTADPALALRLRALWIFGAGLIVLCGSSLLGVIWAAGAVLSWVYLVRGELHTIRWRAVWTPVVATAAFLGPLAGYYLWTIWLGTGASMVGSTRLLNLAFISYEISGIAGLGPGRLEIRQDGFGAFVTLGAIRLTLLIAAAFLSLGVFGLGLCAVARSLPRRAWVAMLLYSFPPGLLLIGLGYARSFRLLGRHYLPLMPLVLGLTALGIASLTPSRRRLGLAAATALWGVWLASGLSLRFSQHHRKDDYRGAAAVAKVALARHETVWWSADPAAASYYGVPFESTSPNAAAVTLIFRVEREELDRLTQPSLVIASKPDIYDGRTDALGAYLLTQQFVPVRDLPAFTIWRRPEAPASPR